MDSIINRMRSGRKVYVEQFFIEMDFFICCEKTGLIFGI